MNHIFHKPIIIRNGYFKSRILFLPRHTKPVGGVTRVLHLRKTACSHEPLRQQQHWLLHAGAISGKEGRFKMGETLRVGWAGIGKMGAPMSRRVLEAGYALSVFEPLPENRATIVAEGANVAHSLEDLAAASDVVVLTIPNDAILRDLVLSRGALADALNPGQILMEMSTVSPEISAEVSAALSERGVAYLRAPVSGSTITASSGNLSVMVSGPDDAYRKVEPMLACFSSRQFYLGKGEEARYLKLVLNALVGATAALLGEALTLGLKGNLSVETMLSVICESAVASPLIAYKRDLLVSRNFDPAFSVSQMMKDFDLILGAAKSDHVPMYLASMIRQQYEAAYADGLAEKDFFVLFEQSERLAGLSPREDKPQNLTAV
ncbi:NAD(P)-dependent oxidoreductase [Rhizobium sophorae]|uniref:NAD(P)-dependent oxidoreductase n=1 Tax=Rhizobium sophorae TaxID=1535242 RepID=A0A7Y3WCQ3_9HYPH|nr:NAD(P)-dependent oxidoreductase [Rhizobium sophorae]